MLMKIISNPQRSPDLCELAWEHLEEFYMDDPNPEIRAAALLWMKSPDPRTRRGGLQISQEWPGNDITQAALDIFNSPYEVDEIRALTAGILANRGVREIIPRLREMLESENLDLKENAICGLGTLKDEESRPALERLVRVGPHRIRSAADRALMELDGKKAAPSRTTSMYRAPPAGDDKGGIQ